MIGSLVDDVLDRTVIAGYTQIGYRVRSRGWDASEFQRMEGKVVLVTGANSGLGLAAAEGFASLGATVWLGVRNAERGEQARKTIVEQSGNGDVHVAVCDLSELKSVRDFAAGFGDGVSRLDVLVNNAGAMTEARRVSADGIELTLATNVVGPFLLTNLLIPLLEKSAPARIVNVSSGGMYTQKLTVDDLQSEHEEFDGPKVYARTKRAEVILTEVWAEQLAGTGVVVHSMHPGWCDTPSLRSSLPRFYKLTKPLLRTPAQGADTIVWLGSATRPSHTSGQFWHDRRPRPTHLLPHTTETPQQRVELLTECIRLSGWHDASAPIASTSTPEGES